MREIVDFVKSRMTADAGKLDDAQATEAATSLVSEVTMEVAAESAAEAAMEAASEAAAEAAAEAISGGGRFTAFR